MEDAIKFAEETLAWVEQSKAEREAELKAFEDSKTKILAHHEDQMIRLGVVQTRLEKIRHQLDNLTSDLAEHQAKTA